MLKKEDDTSFLPEPLRRQIDQLCRLVEQIRGETAQLVNSHSVSEAGVQLQDVLTSTEEATSTIIDTAGAIQALSDGGQASAPDKQRIGELISRIYEACNFQDITGQRIKKVLKSLGTLESSIMKLAETAKSCSPNDAAGVPPLPEAGLLNGPQLSHEAPGQDEIDRLFKSV